MVIHMVPSAAFADRLIDSALIPDDARVVPPSAAMPESYQQFLGAWVGRWSGAVMVAVKLGSAAPIMALWADHSTISPQLPLVLDDLGGVAFVISWLPSAIFVAAAAAALYRAGLVGRPTAYCGFVLGTAGLVLTVIGVHDPLSAKPQAFLLGLLWLLVVSVRLAIRPGTGASAGKASGRADARVAVSA